MSNYTFIIDLDGTIIGDCIYQAEIYKISLILNKLKIKIKINEILEGCYKEKTRLIRPYFKIFIEKMREIYPKSKYYIYTASEKRWAEKELKIIENELKIRMDRPILTRNDCIMMEKENKIDIKKSIEMIKRKIKYKEGEIMIIDDNDVYIDNMERMVKCKYYNYKYFCNYWEYIPIERIKNKIVLKYIEKLIENERLNPYIERKTMKQQIEYYKWLNKKCIEINKENKKYKKDEFWLRITEAIIENKIIIFNKANIKLIQNSIKD